MSGYLTPSIGENSLKTECESNKKSGNKICGICSFQQPTNAVKYCKNPCGCSNIFVFASKKTNNQGRVTKECPSCGNNAKSNNSTKCLHCPHLWTKLNKGKKGQKVKKKKVKKTKKKRQKTFYKRHANTSMQSSMQSSMQPSLTRQSSMQLDDLIGAPSLTRQSSIQLDDLIVQSPIERKPLSRQSSFQLDVQSPVVRQPLSRQSSFQLDVQPSMERQPLSRQSSFQLDVQPSMERQPLSRQSSLYIAGDITNIIDNNMNFDEMFSSDSETEETAGWMDDYLAAI